VSHAAVLHKYGTATEYKGGEDPVYHTPRSHPGGTSRISFTSTDIESTITEEDDEKRETVMSLRETNLSLIRETNISMRWSMVYGIFPSFILCCGPILM
jgi:hypothetical protein